MLGMTPRQPGTGSVFRRERDGRWVARIETGYTPSGGRRTRTKTAATEAEARRKLLQLQREHLAGVTSTSRATVRSWSETWLEQHAARVRPSTYVTDAGAVARWIVPAIGARRLADLTPADVRSVSSGVVAAGRSSTTARHTHGLLLRMLRDATVEGHQVPQRVLLTASPPRAHSDRDALPRDHALAVLDAASRTTDYARWVAALLQGMRQAEVLGLTWECVDFDRGLIDVSWQLQALPRLESGYRLPPGVPVRQLRAGYHLVPPKTSAGRRVVPLVPWMHAALWRWREEAPVNPWGLVWTGVDGRYDEGRVIPRPAAADRRAWERLQLEAGVAHSSGRLYTLHEARHTTATILLELGVDSHVVTAIMGHSSMASTRSYQHVSTVMARAALDRVAERLGLPPVE